MTTYTIRTRRATAASWTAQNPILAQGEAGLETDTLRVKYGDGSTAWTSLGYASSPLGTTAATAAAGNDSRLSDTRTPTDASVTNAKLAAAAANTVKANATAGSAAPTDVAMGASTVLARLASGNIVAATPAQLAAMVGGQALIEEQILGSNTATVTLGSGGTIPQTFRHLRIVLSCRTTRSATNDGLAIQFNTDTTAANYDREYTQASATTTTNSEALGTGTSQQIALVAAASAASTHPGTVVIDVPNYTNTTYWKVAMSRWDAWYGRTTGLMVHGHASVGWANTAAITSLGFTSTNAANLAIGTIVQLYGIG